MTSSPGSSGTRTGSRSWSRSHWPPRACRGSFADGVRARLAGLTDAERLVLHTAALLGRQFDWRLLPQATGLPADTVAAALEHGVRVQLLAVDDGTFRFRHMLTREAVTAGLLPPRRVALAARALAALEAAQPGLPGAAGDLAAELAIQAGEPGRAGVLLTESGRSALGRGALATAASALRHAADLLTDPHLRAEAETLLVEALALAGQVDEAMRIGDRLIAQLTPGGDSRHPAGGYPPEAGPRGGGRDPVDSRAAAHRHCPRPARRRTRARPQRPGRRAGRRGRPGRRRAGPGSRPGRERSGLGRGQP